MSRTRALALSVATAVATLAGYEVVWRATDATLWQHSKFVGNVTQVTLPLSKDNSFFGVRAVDTDGHPSPVTFPVPEF
jgi:hypothetical protein